MMVDISNHMNVIKKYVDNKISTDEFVIAYLNGIKNESRMIGDRLFNPLEELFGDADMCTKNRYLLTKYPETYIDEKTLRIKAKQIYEQLTKLVNEKHY